jgi:carbonic anhydrase
MQAVSALSLDKPSNGLAGLKHWPYDLRSGFMVSMISLPFSMGIAITSGAPPICGIVSAIIAGFVLPFMGGSYVTISGPAAGLAPPLFAGMIWLGSVDLGKGASQAERLEAGYPLVLVAICFAGLVQLVLARLKVARLSAIFPAAAIEGMLAAIGLLIIAKQIPLFMGLNFEAHEFWTILQEAPHHFATMNLQVVGLGIACTALLFILAAVPWRLFKLMPPPVWIFILGTLASLLFLRLGPQNLINVPANLLEHGIVLPHFGKALGNYHFWVPVVYLVFLLVLIDGTESLATIYAVDKIDPYRRRSDPDRTLLAMGVSNMCSSAVGGLTIIPGIVKSTANIMGGGRTQWANFFNACFLLTLLIFGRDLINMVPKAVLAAILVFIGFKLCRPKVWVKVAHIGTEQLLVFTVTVLVTVSTDLLIGIFAGIAMELVIRLWYLGLWSSLRDGDSSAPADEGLLAHFVSLFRNPVTRRELDGDKYRMFVNGPLVCFNIFHMIRELGNRPPAAREICLHMSPAVPLIDHTTFEYLDYLEDDLAAGSHPTKLQIDGWDHLRPLSNHETSDRVALVSTKSLYDTARIEEEIREIQVTD